MKYRTSALLVLFLSTLPLISCRKKINHEEGYHSTLNEPGWVKLTHSYLTEFHAVEVYNNELYVAGDFNDQQQNVSKFAKFNTTTGELEMAIPGYFQYGTVYDLEVLNGKLYLGGDYYFAGTTNFYSLMSMNNNGIPGQIQFCSSLAVPVYDLANFNGNLIVSGNFSPGPGNFIVTRNIDRIVSGSAVGLANINPIVHGTGVHDNELFAVGEDGTYLVWNGSGWTTLNYDGKNSADKIYDLISFNSEIYLLGDFTDGDVLKKFSFTTGTWTSINAITKSATIGSYAGLRVIDNTLYLFGNNLLLNGTNFSNLLRSTDGNTFEKIGDTGLDIRDLTFFEDQLYAATGVGLHRYND